MNLGPRCEVMLDNKCQCPNTVEGYTLRCILHNKLKEAQTTKENVNNEK